MDVKNVPTPIKAIHDAAVIAATAFPAAPVTTISRGLISRGNKTYKKNCQKICKIFRKTA